MGTVSAALRCAVLQGWCQHCFSSSWPCKVVSWHQTSRPLADPYCLLPLAAGTTATAPSSAACCASTAPTAATCLSECCTPLHCCSLVARPKLLAAASMRLAAACTAHWIIHPPHRRCLPGPLPLPPSPASLACSMKVIPPGLDFSSLKVAIPEDPTLKEFEQARAVQDMLERPQSLSPATSPRKSGDTAGAPGSPAATSPSAPDTPSLPPVASPGSVQSPRGGGSSSGGAMVEGVSGPRPAELMLDPTAGPPIWNVSGADQQDSSQQSWEWQQTCKHAAAPLHLLKGPSTTVPGTQMLSSVLSSPFLSLPSAPPMCVQEIARFLRNPLKPAILAMSRPDAKKNITTLVGGWLAGWVRACAGGRGGEACVTCSAGIASVTEAAAVEICVRTHSTHSG